MAMNGESHGSRRAVPRVLLLLCAVPWLGCATFAQRATLATGVCRDRGVTVSEVEDEGNAISWTASCENSSSYHCDAFDDGSGEYGVECEYLPICGNDEYVKTGVATVER